MKRIVFLAIVFALFLISVLDATAQTEISIYPQPDSPLQISNVVQRSEKFTDDMGREWEKLIVNFTLQNICDKTIRAYTLREFSGEFDTHLGSVIAAYKLSGDEIFKPNQFSNEQIGESSSTLSTPSSTKFRENFKLAVDFIEFTDGTTWGKDLSNSAQQIAGIKTGIKKILESLKEANHQGGIEAVIKTLNEMKELSPPDDQSTIWKRGFRTGANSIKSSVKRAYETAGKKAAEIEFQKHSDAYFAK
jgi:hypothetical protein